MTLAVLMMFGFGLILIASAIDNTPVAKTFLAVLRGESVGGLAQPGAKDKGEGRGGKGRDQKQKKAA